MKTKRTNRFIAFALALVMLVPLTCISAFAIGRDDIIADIDEDATLFVVEDFNDLELTTDENGQTTLKKDSTLYPNISGVHTYSKLMQRGEDENDKYLLIPYKGYAKGGNDGAGNFDKVLTLNNSAVSATQTNGVILELEMYLHFDETLNQENCGYEYTVNQADPTVELQIQKISSTNLRGQSLGTASWITLGQIKVRTGEILNVNKPVEGAQGLTPEAWNTLRYEFDLVHGMFKLYVNDNLYTEEGYISGNGTSAGYKNVSIDTGKLLIAKCNKQAGSYNNNDTKEVVGEDGQTTTVPFPYEEMTYVGIDNVAMYENYGYESEPLVTEPAAPGTISGTGFELVTVGQTPMDAGFSGAPSGATIVVDPTDSSNQVAKLPFGTAKEGYWIWNAGNADQPVELTEIQWQDGDESTGVITSAKAGNVTIHGKVWGITEEQQSSTVTSAEDAADYVAKLADEIEYKNSKDKLWYICTGAYAECRYGTWGGVGNVGKPFAPGNMALTTSNFSKFVMQVKYYFSADAAGNIESQMNGSSGAWIDTVQLQAVKDGDVYLKLGGNCSIVNGQSLSANYTEADTFILQRETWYTMHLVYDVETNTMDIFLNGEFIAQVCPNNNGFSGIKANSWSIAKIVRNTLPGSLRGYMLVDDVFLLDASAFDASAMAVQYLQNFNSLTNVSDIDATGVPEDATLVDRAEGNKALQMNIASLTNNLTFANYGSSVSVANKVAFDFKLNLSEDATGTLLGSILKYGDKQFDNANRDTTTYFWNDGVKTALKLYSIDAATGAITIGTQIGAEDATVAATLTKGEWTTISYVLELKTGAVDLYINNRWVASGDVGATNINFTTSMWSIANLVADENVTAAGTVTLDDVRFMVVTDEIVDITMDRENFISATFNGEAVAMGDRFFVTSDVVYEEVTFDMDSWESIIEANEDDYTTAFRKCDPTGLRFTATVDSEMLEALKEEFGAENVIMGTIIVPTDSVQFLGGVTFAKLAANNIKYLDVVANDFFEDETIAGSIVDLHESNINRSFTAVAYVKVTMELGNSSYIYSEEMTNNLAQIAYDFKDEADGDELEGLLGEIVENYASYYTPAAN